MRHVAETTGEDLEVSMPPFTVKGANALVEFAYSSGSSSSNGSSSSSIVASLPAGQSVHHPCQQQQ